MKPAFQQLRQWPHSCSQLLQATSGALPCQYLERKEKSTDTYLSTYYAPGTVPSAFQCSLVELFLYNFFILQNLRRMEKLENR